MIYTIHLTLPPNTSKIEAVEEELVVSPGTLKKIEIQFPPGCAGLVHVQIDHFERVTWPSGGADSFIGDTFPLVFEENYRILEIPRKFIVRGWNLDDTYPHMPIIRLGILPLGQTLLEVFKMSFIPPGMR
jgi:hypothetical protein